MKWTSISKYVHHETGEVLTKKEVEKNYRIIKKDKYVTIDRDAGKGKIEWVSICTTTGTQRQLW